MVHPGESRLLAEGVGAQRLPVRQPGGQGVLVGEQTDRENGGQQDGPFITFAEFHYLERRDVAEACGLVQWRKWKDRVNRVSFFFLS